MNPRLTQEIQANTRCLMQKRGRRLAILLGWETPQGPGISTPTLPRFTHVCDGRICWCKREGKKRTENRACGLLAPALRHSSSPGSRRWAASLTANLAAHSTSCLREPGRERRESSQKLQMETPFFSSGFKELPPSREYIRHVPVGGGEKEFSRLTSYPQQINEKKLQNLFSTRAETVSLHWGVGWRTLCFEAVSVTARRGDRREATGGTRKDGASAAEASLQQRRGSASPISTWPRCFQSYVPAPTR